MSWTPQSKCNLCKLIINGDKELQKRIYESSRFNNGSDLESLHDIQRAYGGLFSYNAIIKHCKKHQTIDDIDQVKRSRNAIALHAERRIKETIQKDIDNADLVRETVISEGLEALKDGRMKLTANHLLKAASDKSTFQLKRKDQAMDFMNMVYHFSSGEDDGPNTRKYDQQVIDGETSTSYNASEITSANIKAIED